MPGSQSAARDAAKPDPDYHALPGAVQPLGERLIGGSVEELRNPLRLLPAQQPIREFEQHLRGQISGKAEVAIEFDVIGSFGSQ